ncbi:MULTISPECIES: copper homeostasis protein CutC [Staphylococcus]|uniref:copper homeostasis protein CutC n=1 Tax=Staphylococcus sp. GDH8C109P TaxID=2804088 RepID=UPI001AEC0826|nr:copper homeostasis protein CutC [Staphylococcus sp. GDH8C109P]
MIKEAVVETIQQVEYAIENGADRVELCDYLHVGGTTPSIGMIEIATEICKANDVEIAVMIRPRGGDFVYSLYDFEIMQRDIKAIKSFDIDYFVFGCLTDDNTLNEWQMKTLKQLASPIPVVCHMAFDEIHLEGQVKALHKLIELGFSRLLTHGGPSDTNIFDNLNQLGKLVVNSGGKIEIMPGGGLTKSNVQELITAFPFQEVHGTKIV